MKFYSATYYFYNHGENTTWREDEDIRTEKHEISETAYNLFVNEVFAGKKPIKNSDGSVSYYTREKATRTTETVFWIE